MMSWYVSHVVDEPVAARLTSRRSPSSTSPLRFASTNRSEPFREMPAAIEAPGIQDRADRPQPRRERTLKFRSGYRRVSVNRVSLEVEGRLESGADRVLRGRVAGNARHACTAGPAIESQIHRGPVAGVLSFDARNRPHDGDGTSRTPVVEAVDLREGSRPNEHLPDQESGCDDDRRNRDHQDDPTLPPRHRFWLRRLHPVRQELSTAKPFSSSFADLVVIVK